jgi:hypothetical protein
MVSVGGAPLTLNAQMARAFNEAFVKPQGKGDIFRASDLPGALLSGPKPISTATLLLAATSG